MECAATSMTCGHLARSCLPHQLRSGTWSIQLTFARSIDPIVALEHSITRMAVARSGSGKAIWRQPHHGAQIHRALWAVCRPRLCIFFPCQANRLRRERSGIALAALEQMFEHDRSAARGEMSTRGLYVFKHDGELGNAPAHNLFELIQVKKNYEESARDFADYNCDSLKRQTFLRESHCSGKSANSDCREIVHDHDRRQRRNFSAAQPNAPVGGFDGKSLSP